MPVDITVYLPDEIGAQAKKAGMNFSRTLRDALESELEHMSAMKEITKDAQEWLLDLVTSDGEPYLGRVMGRLLYENGRGDEIFVTADKRIIFYNPDQERYDVLEDDEDAIGEVLGRVCDTHDEYISTMAQLGFTATVDL